VGVKLRAVRVTNTAIGKCNIYWGGPREKWIEQFVRDAVSGVYGEPNNRYAGRARVVALARSARRSVA
jgi:hypothetical protein